jgi:hypothetical protein
VASSWSLWRDAARLSLKIWGKKNHDSARDQDIHGLDAELTQLEKRYGLLSADFYHLYKAGELEQSRDFIQWVGYYEAKLAREAAIEKSCISTRELRQQPGLAPASLEPLLLEQPSGSARFPDGGALIYAL